MTKMKKLLRTIIVWFSIAIIVCVFLLSFPPSEYILYKYNLLGKPVLGDIKIKMKDGWYMSFHSKHGIGKIVYILKKDKRKKPFKGQPYLVFSKLKGWVKDKEVTFTKIHITDKLYQGYKKIAERVKSYPWEEMIILRSEQAAQRSERPYYYALIKDKRLVIITPDLESLNEIITIEKIKN